MALGNNTELFLERFTPVSRSKKLSQKAEEALKKLGFQPFFRLPPELRARIWAIALSDQTKFIPLSDLDPNNDIDIHQIEEKTEVVSSRGYPTVFFVNREARYEAARVDGGKWYSLGVGAIEVYANLAKDHVAFGSCYAHSMPESSLFHPDSELFNCYSCDYYALI